MDKTNQQKPSDESELSEDQLDQVSGGSDINPQPLPPARHNLM